MRITIVGAGVIGSNLAKDLSEQNHEVYVVEKNPEVAAKANERLDAKVFVGEGTDPNVLKKAGIESADLVIAVTESDATNFVVCSLAEVFGAKKKIARIRNIPLEQTLEEFGFHRFCIDEIINPELVAANSIVKVIKAPGSHEVADFAEGRILLRSFTVPEKSPLCGASLGELRDEDSPWPFLVVAIMRNGDMIVPKGETTLKNEDRIYVLLPRNSLGEFLAFLDPSVRRPEKIIIYGATSIGEKVAKDLLGYARDIIVLEEDEVLANDIAGRLNGVRVINGSPSEKDILKECGIENADIFVSASASDPSNLVSAVLAKKAGAKKTIILTQQPDYLSVMDSLDIDVMINPRFLAVDQILRFVRGRSVSAVAKFAGCNAEALELIPEEGAQITRAPLKEIKFPENSIVGAVFRGEEAFLADGKTQIQAGETTIVFCQEKSVDKIQKLFSGKRLF